MKQNLYQLYDLEAQTTVGPITPFTRHAAAVRAFGEVFADKNTAPGKYPEQYHVLFLGSIDCETAEVTAQTPTPVLTGTDWLEAQKKAARIAYELDGKETPTLNTERHQAEREKQLARLKA